MSLEAMLAAHDEAALTALASAGLLRRARAAAVGGLTRDGATARAEVEGHRVEIGPKGLKAARCSCPATGICLHMLAAVLALRAGSAAAAEEAPPSAEAALLALSDAALAAFAGADWGAALDLVRREEPPEIEAAESSVRVLLPVLLQPVTFLAGGELRAAIWKGVEGRRRLAVAAAALALRKARGLAPAEAPEAVRIAAAKDSALFVQAAQEIEAALPALLNGAGSLAADRLADLALSARIEGAPRPAGALAGLVRAAERSGAGGHADLLTAAARTRALLHLLARRPGDPRLRGALRRRYAQAGPTALVVLGAKAWSGESGARGLRIFAYDRAAGRWLTAGPARPAGLDARFEPSLSYRQPLLGAASAEALMGRRLLLEAPGISEEGALSPEAAGSLASASEEDLPPAFSDWAAAAADLAARFGSPLARGRVFPPVLLRPTRIEKPRWSPNRREAFLPLLDARGRELPLLLDSVSPFADVLIAWRSAPPLLLAEASERSRALRLTLVSAVKAAPGLEVWNPGLDRAHGRGFSPDADRIGPSQPPAADRLEAFAVESFVAAADLALGRDPDPGARRLAEELGLSEAARLLAAAPSPAAALRLAWRTAEWEWLIRLGAFSRL